MLDHFMENVWQGKKLKGKAKAMVVTRNIESAILYYLAMRQILKDRNAPFKAVVAFTGKKLVDGIEYPQVNQRDTSKRFVVGQFALAIDEGLVPLPVSLRGQIEIDNALG